MEHSSFFSCTFFTNKLKEIYCIQLVHKATLTHYVLFLALRTKAKEALASVACFYFPFIKQIIISCINSITQDNT